MPDHDSSEQTPPPAGEDAKATPGSPSMHEGIGDWCDCCSCEPEEQWVQLAEEMGIDLSDYEDPEQGD